MTEMGLLGAGWFMRGRRARPPNDPAEWQGQSRMHDVRAAVWASPKRAIARGPPAASATAAGKEQVLRSCCCHAAGAAAGSREERGTDIRHSAPLPLHIRGHGPPAIRNNTWRYRHHDCRDACATHSDDNSCRRLSPWNAATAGGRCFSHHRGAKRSHVGVIDRSERASGHAADPAMSLQSKLALLSHDSVLVQRFRVPGERAHRQPASNSHTEAHARSL